MRRRTGEKGLKKDAIGFAEALVIGIASTAPAYSLAAVIGLLVVTVGVQAPAVLVTSFVPMFFIAAAFYYLNRADQDAGTTFSWVTRAMGPYAGWMGGWAVGVTGVLVIGSLADVASRYTYLLFGLDAGSKGAVTALAVVYIALMTLVCILGIELSARLQNVLIVAQVGALLLFAVVALYKVFGDNAPDAALTPEASWFSPFAISDGSALIPGLLIGVFIYWGWESSVNITEEVEDSAVVPGRAAVISTVVLLVTYVSVGTAVVAFAGLGTVEGFAGDDAILSTIATDVLGSPLDKVVVLAVLTSALASTQTTILPASRISLSMAFAGAIPASLGRVHRRYLTPHVATVVIGALAIAWYVPMNIFSENFLYDTIAALSLLISFYYSLTGFSCVIYYRKELFKSAKNLAFIGVAPLLGAGMLAYLFVRSLVDLSDPGGASNTGGLFGLGVPLVVGLGLLLLGAALMVLWRTMGNERFFGRAPETVPLEVAAGRARVSETTDVSPGKG